MQKQINSTKNTNYPNKYIYENDFRTSVHESTPVFNMIPTRHFIYENYEKNNIHERKSKEYIHQKLRKGKTTESKLFNL